MDSLKKIRDLIKLAGVNAWIAGGDRVQVSKKFTADEILALIPGLAVRIQESPSGELGIYPLTKEQIESNKEALQKYLLVHWAND